MTDAYQRVYDGQAEAYDRLVAAEDCEGRILPALAAVHPLAGARVAEVGVGTGRLTRLLVDGGARTIVGVERAPAMLAVARRHLRARAPHGSGCAWQLAVGDARALPLRAGAVDLALAGWVFGHTTRWHPDSWRRRVASCLAEFDRVTRSGGTEVLLETLGTGTERCEPPSPELGAYYTYLEQEHGFERVELRTDYRFESAAGAAEACGFFFGETIAARILERGWARVPEWTGLWWRERRRPERSR